MPFIPRGERGPAERMPGAGSTRQPVDARKIPNPQKIGARVIAWYMRRPINRVLYGISALFVAIFMLMAQTVMAQRQARQEVMLQDESVLSLNLLMETMLDAETGQRGYLVTGNPSYLEPFLRAKARLDPELSALHRMALRADDAEQDHIARAEDMIRAKLYELNHTVELARAGMTPSAIAEVQSNVGQRYMDGLRQELTWLRDEKAAARQAAFDRVQSLENRLLPLVGVLGLGMFVLVVVALRGERHRADAQAEARQLVALRAANDQTQLLARELNHRVKNLFSVVLSIITISARKRAPTAEVLDDIRSRVHALSLAHSSSQGTGAEESSPLVDVIANIMRPYAEGQPDRVRMSGPAVDLPARMITPMGLLIHELATNGSKYGALSAEFGVVEIDWTVEAAPAGGRNLTLTWIESGGPALCASPAGPPDPGTLPKTGFGSRLTAMAAQQMGGRLERSWPETGATVKLFCPLP